MDSYDPTIEETFNKNIKIRNQVNIIFVAKSTLRNFNVNDIIMGAVIVLGAVVIFKCVKGLSKKSKEWLPALLWPRAT